MYSTAGKLLPASALVAVSTLVLGILGTGTAAAATAPGLGTADGYAILAGSTVTNTNPSVITGSLGVSPGSAVTGFPPGVVQGGETNVANAVSLQAQSDLTKAYDTAAGAPSDVNLSAELGSPTPLVPGVYTATSALQLTGTVTLDGLGDPNSVFIFQIPSALTTASNAVVNLIGEASPCNVFWQVGTSATLGTTTSFVGTIMALASISVQNSATIQGRALARNGQVSLDNNVITRPECGDSPVVTPPVVTTPVVTSPVVTPPVIVPIPPVVVIPGLPPITVPGVPPVVTVPGLPPITIPGVPPAGVTTPPAVPGVPVTPGTPGVPNVPVTPGTPGVPNVPVTPGTPPGVPNVPVTPGTPPGVPNTPNGGGQVTQVPLGGVDTGDGSTARHHA